MMKRIVYLTSGKVGLHSFTYNELDLLEKKGLNVLLCLTQLNNGPFLPKKKWETVVFRSPDIFPGFVFAVFRHPLLLAKYFREALKDRTLRFFFISLGFYKRLRNYRDISSVHVQMADHKLYIGYFLSGFLQMKLTATLHAHELYSRDAYSKPSVVKKYLTSCEKVITISDFNKSELVNRFTIAPEKVQVMYLYPAINGLESPEGKKKILITANWVEKKGFRTLLKALSLLENRDYVLWIAGGEVKTDESIDVKKLAKELGIIENVRFLGFQPRAVMEILFEHCDIFCLPSVTDMFADGNVREREGIPIALMDAMSWGKPVITTRHAGIPELVQELLIEEHDVEGLKNKLEQLMDDDLKCKELGRKNMEIIKSKFSKENVGRLAAILEDLQ